MSARPEIVITAMGAVTPLGIGCEALASGLRDGRSGVGPIAQCDPSALPIRLAGEVRDFEGKAFLPKEHRKSLKIMSRAMQSGIAAASEAWTAAGLKDAVDPDRVGVVFGADNMCTDPEECVQAYSGCIKDGSVD